MEADRPATLATIQHEMGLGKKYYDGASHLMLKSVLTSKDGVRKTPWVRPDDDGCDGYDTLAHFSTITPLEKRSSSFNLR
jgi:hypothetical protein